MGCSHASLDGYHNMPVFSVDQEEYEALVETLEGTPTTLTHTCDRTPGVTTQVKIGKDGWATNVDNSADTFPVYKSCCHFTLKMGRDEYEYDFSQITPKPC